MPGDVDLDDLPYEDLSDEEEAEMQTEKESRRKRELLDKVDYSRLVSVWHAEMLTGKEIGETCYIS